MTDADRIAIDAEGLWPDDTDEDRAIVVNWFVREEGRVEAGDPICEIQIEKVDVDVPAPATGVVEEIAVAGDDEFERGATLAYLRPE